MGIKRKRDDLYPGLGGNLNQDHPDFVKLLFHYTQYLLSKIRDQFGSLIQMLRVQHSIQCIIETHSVYKRVCFLLSSLN